MTARHHEIENLISLVGGNPLPIYLVAATLRPQNLWLVYSDGTREVADHIRSQVRKNIKGVVCHLERDHCISDSHDAQKVASVIAQFQPGFWLDYTGGTKVMTVHGYKEWSSKSLGSGAKAVYLDDGDGRSPARLRFADGTASQPVSVHLDIDTLAGLHGWNDLERREFTDGCPTRDDARKFLERFLDDLDKYPNNREERMSSLLRRKEGGFGAQCYENAIKEFEKDHLISNENKVDLDMTKFGLGLSIGRLPGPKFPQDPDTNNLLWYRWLRFVRKNEWFEDWCASCVSQIISDEDKSETGVKITLAPSKRTFELDVVIIRGHRLYLLSCTTDNRAAVCKSKLFEAAHRARQLGGDLARSAIACPLANQRRDDNNDDANEDQDGDGHDDVQQDFNSVWEQVNKPKVFGLDHLRAWRKGNLLSLRTWLNS